MLKPKYKGKDLFKIETPAGAKVEYHPLQERILAARWSSTPLPVFFEMDPDVMAMTIASYRIDRKIESIIHHEQNKKTEAAARAAKAGTSKGPGGRHRGRS